MKQTQVDIRLTSESDKMNVIILLLIKQKKK